MANENVAIIALCFIIGAPLFILMEFGYIIIAATIVVIILLVSVYRSGKSIFADCVDISLVDRMDGVGFENFVASLLEVNGFDRVATTKASGDYGVDLTARQSGQKYAFQCKCYSGNLGVKAVQEVYAGAKMYNAHKCVVVTNSHFTKNAVMLSRQLGVELWDRERLARLMKASSKQPAASVSGSSPGRPQTTPQKLTINEVPKEPQRTEDSVGEIKQLQSNLQSDLKKDWSINDMATVLGAGTYVFGEDIPLGKYNLKAISGVGMLKFQKLEDGEWDEEWVNFGIEDYCTKTYFGLSLPKGKCFEITGNVMFEISKAKMIEVE